MHACTHAHEASGTQLHTHTHTQPMAHNQWHTTAHTHAHRQGIQSPEEKRWVLRADLKDAIARRRLIVPASTGNTE